MSADRFYAKIPNSYHSEAFILALYFVYYLTVDQGKDAATAAMISRCFVECELPVPKRLPQYLSEGVRKSECLIKVARGYRLHRTRKAALAGSLSVQDATVQTSDDLRALEILFADPDTKEFLREAIVCFEAGASRAAVVMTWLLTFDHFLNHIFTNKLAEFNRRLGVVTANNPKARITRINKIEDFEEIGESDIIAYCRSENIITNGVRNALDEGLRTRNSAAHPSNVTITKATAIHVIENLVRNVIRKL